MMLLERFKLSSSSLPGQGIDFQKIGQIKRYGNKQTYAETIDVRQVAKIDAFPGACELLEGLD